MSHSRLMAVLALVSLALSIAPAVADDTQPLSALARMPVKEVTVFKDGHAFVLHEGKMPVDSAGNVLRDYLPTPVLGTYWASCGDKNARLSAVVASQRRVSVERTALSLRDLLQANVGAAGTFTEVVSAKEQMVAYTGKGAELTYAWHYLWR